MTLTATYDPANARVRLTCDGLTGAESVLIERSTNGVAWTIVRGCAQTAIDGDALADGTVDDYEFADRVLNTYRASPQSVGSPLDLDGSFEDEEEVTDDWEDPVLAMWAQDDTKAHSGSSSGLLTSAGAAGDTANVTTFVDGGIALPVTAWLNASADAVGNTSLLIVWSDEDGNPIGESLMDAELVADTWVEVHISDPPPDESVFGLLMLQMTDVPDGTTVNIDDLSVPQPDEQTATIVPVLDGVWLKTPTRPFLNRPVTVIEPGDPAYAGRGATASVIGRTEQIAVTDLRAGATWQLQLRTADDAESKTLEWVLAGNEVLFVHAPAGSLVRTGYILAGDVATARARPRGHVRHWTIPVTSVVPPGPDVAAAQNTWQTLLEGYATWQDVLDAWPTWGELLSGLFGFLDENIR